MRHLKEADTGRRTVLMIQLQNEVGLIGDSRDRSAPAEAAFAKPVPPELMDYLQKNKLAHVARSTQAVGGRGLEDRRHVAGSLWQSTATDEIFMAWNYARYMDHMAKAGKAEYAAAGFTNTWLVQPQDQAPGDYPSGCPEPLVIDVWKAGAPSIDINAPDVHLRNFNDWSERFHRPNNPLFVPESYGDLGGAANAFYGIGQHAGIGYSPFGVNSPERWGEMRPGTNTPVSNAIEDIPLAKAYAVLAQMTPLITDAQAKGTIGAAWLHHPATQEGHRAGGFCCEHRHTAQPPEPGAGAGLCHRRVSGPQRVLYSRPRCCRSCSRPTRRDPEIAGLGPVETGKFVNGKWNFRGRRINGDDVVLEYDQAAAAAKNQSGSGLIFGGDGPYHSAR